MSERPYELTVTVKVKINGDSKELAADHLGTLIMHYGLEGIELGAVDTITVKIPPTGFGALEVAPKRYSTAESEV